MEQLLNYLLDYLNSIYPLSAGLREHLRSIIKYRELPRNGFLLRKGQVNRDIHFIMKGLLRCYYHHEDKEVSSWFMKERDTIVSIDSFYNQVPSYEYIQALEDSEMFYISFDELEDTRRRFLEFNYIGWKLTTEYLILWTKQLYGIRMRLARERYQFLLDNHPELLQRVPSKYLASFLDLNQITLSKMKGYNKIKRAPRSKTKRKAGKKVKH
jgi:CRP/FNR family transcriptional regulator, anaerobic regulatory protein